MYYVKHKYIDKINIGGIIFFGSLLHDRQTAKFSGYSITHMQNQSYMNVGIMNAQLNTCNVHRRTVCLLA